MSSILIKNGVIVSSLKTFKGDVLIQDSKIIQIDKKIGIFPENCLIIDADKKYIFPGAIDPHVHFGLKTNLGQTSDDFYTGSRAAIAGGTTTVIDFVTPENEQSYIEALNVRKKDSENSMVDYSFHMSPTWIGENTETEIKKCIENEGIPSFKVYMAYKDSIGLKDKELIEIMNLVKKVGGIVTLHCENGDIIPYLQRENLNRGNLGAKYHAYTRPPIVEGEAVNRAILFSKLVNCPIYIVHASTKNTTELILRAQRRGQLVFAETCPQYLLLDESKYFQEDSESAKFIMSPPLRPKYHKTSLWNALRIGIIQTVGTDHCTFNLKDKLTGANNNFTKIPNGVGGVEHRLSLLYTYGVLENRINLQQFVNLTSTFPAKLFGLSYCKGDIDIGLDADIIIWDPIKEHTISVENQFQNCDYSVFEGIKLMGLPEIVIVKGKILFRDGKINDTIEYKGDYLVREKTNYFDL